MINEAIYAVMEGVATPEAVDEVFKLGMAHPMGPLTLADFIGLDVCLDIMRVLHAGLGDSKYRPCPLLVPAWWTPAGWAARADAASTSTSKFAANKQPHAHTAGGAFLLPPERSTGCSNPGRAMCRLE